MKKMEHPDKKLTAKTRKNHNNLLYSMSFIMSINPHTSSLMLCNKLIKKTSLFIIIVGFKLPKITRGQLCIKLKFCTSLGKIVINLTFYFLINGILQG